MTGALSLDRLGALNKIGQGGQGNVYSAPSVRVSFAKSMVYKEYKRATLASLDVDALRAMPDFLESLAYLDGAKLIELAAWPCRVVEDHGRITGFVMPAIADEFFCDFWTSNSVKPSLVMSEFQHLLNDPLVVAARFGGIGISDRDRCELLEKVVEGLAFLHQRGVCVGDISPKNLLFALVPEPAVYFLDCDAMRVNGISLSHQVETPGWDVPAGEEKATVFSDRYKLGLLALRLFVGDQSVRDPGRLAASIHPRLASVVIQTLFNIADQRPDLDQWRAAIAEAIPLASTDKPTVARPGPNPPPPPPPPPPRPPSPPPPPNDVKNKMSWLLIPAALAALFVIVRTASGGGNAPPDPPPVPTPTAEPTRAETITATATQTVTKTVQPTAEAAPITRVPGSSADSIWRGTVVGTCDEGGSCGVKQRTAPYISAPRLYPQDLRDGMEVPIVCSTTGDLRSSAGHGTSNIWLRLTNGAYVNSVYIDLTAPLSAIASC